MLTVMDRKQQNHKKVILPTISSPKCQCDAEHNFKGGRWSDPPLWSGGWTSPTLRVYQVRNFCLQNE